MVSSLNLTTSFWKTLVPSSVMIISFTLTRPAWINSSASLLEQMPLLAIYLLRRTPFSPSAIGFLGFGVYSTAPLYLGLSGAAPSPSKALLMRLPVLSSLLPPNGLRGRSCSSLLPPKALRGRSSSSLLPPNDLFWRSSFLPPNGLRGRSLSLRGPLPVPLRSLLNLFSI